MEQKTKRRLGIIVLFFPWFFLICFACTRTLVLPGIQEIRSLRFWDATENAEDVEETPIVGEAIEEYLEARPISTLEATYVVERSGSVDELGGVHAGVVYPGDNASNQADFQGFMTFDLTGIPLDADVEEAVLAFESCTISGRPFREPPMGLGLLFVEVIAYGDLEAEDYAAPVETDISYPVDHCPPNGLDVTDAVLMTREAGELQFRLRFEGSNEDNYRDDVTFVSPSLMVLYLLGDTE